MIKTQTTQKKKLISYIYAAIVALLVLACAITIALVNSKTTPVAETSVTNETVQVAASTFVLPMKNATIIKDYSGSELQYNETLKQWEIHKAIDFISNEDNNVYAVADGTISNIYTNYLEGTVIEITHKDGIVSVYKSLNNEVSTKIGNKVGAGNVIGSVSESMAQELNVGAHLHFEMFKDGTKINPNNYLDLGIK